MAAMACGVALKSPPIIHCQASCCWTAAPTFPMMFMFDSLRPTPSRKYTDTTKTGLQAGGSTIAATALPFSKIWHPKAGSFIPISFLTKIATPPDAPPLLPAVAGAAIIFHPFLSAHAEASAPFPSASFVSCARSTWARVARNLLRRGPQDVVFAVSTRSWKVSLSAPTSSSVLLSPASNPGDPMSRKPGRCGSGYFKPPCGRGPLHGTPPSSSGLTPPGPGFLACPMRRCPRGGLRGRSSLLDPQASPLSAPPSSPPSRLSHAPFLRLRPWLLLRIRLTFAAFLLHRTRGPPCLRPAIHRQGPLPPPLLQRPIITPPSLPLPTSTYLCTTSSAAFPSVSQPMAWAAHRTEGRVTSRRCASGLLPSRSVGRMPRPLELQENPLDQDARREVTPAPRNSSLLSPRSRGRLPLALSTQPMKLLPPVAWARRVGGGATTGRFQSSHPPPRRAASRGRSNCTSGLPPPRSTGRMLRPQVLQEPVLDQENH